MSKKAEGSGAGYQGQLFQGEAKSKSWTPLVAGQVAMALVSRSDGLWLEATKNSEKVWEGRLDDKFKHRLRDNFIQWQQKTGGGGGGGGGSRKTFGLRLKSSAVAQELSDAITAGLSEQAKVNVEEPDVVLKFHLPGRDSLCLPVPHSATVLEALKLVCTHRGLEPSSYVLALPPDTPQGQPILCHGAMPVGQLRTAEVHVAKRAASKGKHSSSAATTTSSSELSIATANGTAEQTLLLQVELPNDQRTVVRVSPVSTLKELLGYVCEKRNLDPARHWFALPATEESVAGKTLEQLKINSITVVTKEMDSPSPVHGRKHGKTSMKGSPKASRRVAPPPPPQTRRSQPELMKELAAEMAGRKLSIKHKKHSTEDMDFDLPPLSEENAPPVEASDSPLPPSHPERGMRKGDSTVSRGTLRPRNRPAPLPPGKTPADSAVVTPGVDDPGNMPRPLETDEEIRPPPPVAEKPKKRKQHSVSRDQSHDVPDGIPAEDLDQLVLTASGTEVAGRKGKVKAQTSRSDMSDSIVEGLLKQAESRGRYMSVKAHRKKELVSQVEQRGTRHGSLEKDKVFRPLSPALEEENKPSGQDSKPSGQDNKISGQDSKPSGQDNKPSSQEATDGSTRSVELKRKPRGPAPPPPKAATLARSHGSTTTTTMSTRTTRPSRRAPSRPAPGVPALQRGGGATVPKAETGRAKEMTEDAPRPSDVAAPPTVKSATSEENEAPIINGVTVSNDEPPVNILGEENNILEETDSAKPSDDDGRKISQEEEERVGSSPEQTSEGDKASPSGGRAHVSLTPPTSRRAATAVCKETQDGGKVLIVHPSPLSEKKDKTALVFRLPPPPPASTDQVQPSASTSAGITSYSEEEGREKDELKHNDNDVDVAAPVSKDSAILPKYQIELSPEHAKLDETVLSNEYTNLDDESDEDIATTDFSLEDNLEPINANTGMGQQEEKRLGSAGEEETSDSESSTSSTGALGAYDIATGGRRSIEDTSETSSDEGGFEIPEQPPMGFAGSPPKGFLATTPPKSSPPPPKLPDTSPPSLNSSSPRSARSSPGKSPPKPPRKSPPSLSPRPSPRTLRINNNTNNNNNNNNTEEEEPALLSSLPPPPAGFDREPLDSEDTIEDTGIVLLSVKKNEEEAPVISEMEAPHSSDIVLPVATTNEGGSEATECISERPTSIETKPTASPERAGGSLNLPSPAKSPIPPKPKPPPFVPPKKSKQAGSSLSSSSFSPKPFRRVSAEEAEEELMGKLRVRQKKIEAFERSKHPPQIQLPTSEPSSLQQQATPLQQQATPTPVQPGTNDVQFQLQFLQQQMLQQQMLQLQQQFQHMQNMAYQQPNPGVATVMMPPQAGYPAPNIYGMPGAAAPAGMMPLPGQQHPMMPQQFVGGVQGGVIPQAAMIPAAGLATAMQPGQFVNPLLPTPSSGHSTTNPSSLTTSGSTSPVSEGGGARGETSPPHSRKTSSGMRSQVLGKMEDHFDSLMEEVRETDPSSVLRKIDEEDKEEPMSSYTGMTAALHQALQQRRIHFTDKRHSVDADASTSSQDESRLDWGSP